MDGWINPVCKEYFMNNNSPLESEIWDVRGCDGKVSFKSFVLRSYNFLKNKTDCDTSNS